jgi:quercetin dioxygenase-like cupin family protein
VGIRPLLVVVALLGALTGCGDDSSEANQGDPAPSAAPTGPVLLGKGAIAGQVKLAIKDPVFSVRTVTIPPGGTTGWHRHDGTETSVVTRGRLNLFRAGACKALELGPGDALFIPDGTAHMARNDGDVPAEVTVTYLLRPGAPDRADAPAAC